MISEEKMIHIVHLIIDGLKKEAYAEFPNPEAATHEAKRVCFEFMKDINNVGELARKRILSQRNCPIENSRQWDTLYEKYYNEEMKKRGG